MRHLILACLWLVVAGCGSGSGDDKSGDDDSDSVFDPLTQSLDKAQETEDIVLQQKEDLDEALRKAEGDSDEAAERSDEDQ